MVLASFLAFLVGLERALGVKKERFLVLATKVSFFYVQNIGRNAQVRFRGVVTIRVLEGVRSHLHSIG